jgi:hypothetical protein
MSEGGKEFGIAEEGGGRKVEKEWGIGEEIEGEEWSRKVKRHRSRNGALRGKRRKRAVTTQSEILYKLSNRLRQSEGKGFRCIWPKKGII